MTPAIDPQVSNGPISRLYGLALTSLDEAHEALREEALRLRDEYFEDAKARADGKIIYRLIDVRGNGKGSVSIVWCKVFFIKGSNGAKKHARTPIAKGLGYTYAATPVTIGMDAWFVELFHLYEPKLAMIREQLLNLGKVRKLLLMQQRKVNANPPVA
ncbi:MULTISPECIES: conjugative transfer protein MobI(A/C) [Pseudomonas]|jgi:hypothetical protein|uniref:Uncharacterized protein n=1 Tax=Pseudomonas oryzihabitans TaxID=47885 RepID=A0A178LMT4_9PSED|nr:MULTISPECIES: conjugative transfer protein MobI(A/C) [Pseudomonas]NMY91801.1 hypothetical protein [Pseudomonas psychrotolerans]NMY91986.1 hypothetical protein [Pseudomonas psychrotolerans]NMZ66886.1 hypothetical protein [Pseudomonas oryzihabitans]NRH44633.1 hypothetical protein [Pseudomonas sp. MS15a(2019)]OAN31836.1 hypothetical protein A4V15_12275 [Pseudomonas oryzihabitans]